LYIRRKVMAKVGFLFIRRVRCRDGKIHKIGLTTKGQLAFFNHTKAELKRLLNLAAVGGELSRCIGILKSVRGVESKECSHHIDFSKESLTRQSMRKQPAKRLAWKIHNKLRARRGEELIPKLNLELVAPEERTKVFMQAVATVLARRGIETELTSHKRAYPTKHCADHTYHMLSISCAPKLRKRLIHNRSYHYVTMKWFELIPMPSADRLIVATYYGTWQRGGVRLLNWKYGGRIVRSKMLDVDVRAIADNIERCLIYNLQVLPKVRKILGPPEGKSRKHEAKEIKL
jgi:hypothetical protein